MHENCCRMSLHPQPPSQIPLDTVRVAVAAFPKGNIYIRMRDELGTIYTDEAFAPLFPLRGKPALAPARKRLNYHHPVYRRVD